MVGWQKGWGSENRGHLTVLLRGLVVGLAMVLGGEDLLLEEAMVARVLGGLGG